MANYFGHQHTCWGQIADEESLKLVERMQWQQAKEEIVHLFCDASGSPPHLGAVACIGGDWFWTHMAVPASVLGAFRRRRDSCCVS